MEFNLADNHLLGPDGKPLDRAREYLKIILKAQAENRVKTKNEYFELHHIIPKACGGNNSKSNLVLLTPEEHYICHWLLTDIYLVGKEHQSMVYAWNCLNNTRKITKSNDLQENSIEYSNLKKEFSKLSSEMKMGSKHPQAKKILQIDPISINIIKEWGSIAEASRETGADKATLSKITKNKLSEKSKGFYWCEPQFYDEFTEILKLKKQEKIYRLGPKTGEILETLNREEVISKYNLAEAVFTNIVRKDTRKTSRGFCWANDNTLANTVNLIKSTPIPNKGKGHNQIKKLFQIDPKTGEVINEFNYAKEVLLKYPEFNYSNITKAARSDKKSLINGFYWSYVRSKKWR